MRRRRGLSQETILLLVILLLGLSVLAFTGFILSTMSVWAGYSGVPLATIPTPTPALAITSTPVPTASPTPTLVPIPTATRTPPTPTPVPPTPTSVPTSSSGQPTPTRAPNTVTPVPATVTPVPSTPSPTPTAVPDYVGTLTVDRGDGGIYYAGEDIEFCYRLSPDGIKYDYLHYTRFGQMDEALTDVYQGNAVACFTKEAPYGAFGRHDFRGSFLVDGLVVAGASTFIYVVEEWEFFGEVEDISHDCLFQGACWAYVSVTEVLEGSLAEDEVIFVAGPDGDACEGYFDDSLFAGQLVVVRGVTDGSGTVDICPDPDYFIDFW